MSVQQDFIDLISLGAQECQYMSGMFASVTIAQACLETGYNSARPIDVNTNEDSFNVFGIKSVKNMPFVTSKTWEEVKTLPKNYLQYQKLANGKFRVQILADFIKFSSIAECVLYRAKFLIESPYYGKALNANTPEEAAYYLIHTGFKNSVGEEISYATDSKYPDKIISIIKTYNLKKYDLTQEDLRMISELKTLVEQQGKEIDKLKANAVKAASEQKVAVWAQQGADFVEKFNLSDGTRPESPMTRQEFWKTLESYDTLVLNKGVKRKG